MAAVLDEAMGFAAWMSGHAVVARRLTTEFLAMMPLETVFTLEAWVTRVEERFVHTRGRLLDGRRHVRAEAEGLFVVVGLERFQALLKQARPLSERKSWPG
jgi:acyl-coenzyme A thioesterase PaaI-like protein